MEARTLRWHCIVVTSHASGKATFVRGDHPVAMSRQSDSALYQDDVRSESSASELTTRSLIRLQAYFLWNFCKSRSICKDDPLYALASTCPKAVRTTTHLTTSTHRLKSPETPKIAMVVMRDAVIEISRSKDLLDNNLILIAYRDPSSYGPLRSCERADASCSAVSTVWPNLISDQCLGEQFCHPLSILCFDLRCISGLICGIRHTHMARTFGHLSMIESLL